MTSSLVSGRCREGGTRPRVAFVHGLPCPPQPVRQPWKQEPLADGSSRRTQAMEVQRCFRPCGP